MKKGAFLGVACGSDEPGAGTGAAAVLVLAVLAAGYGPALRASRIDPWNALRHD